jgi:hypothetical protein
VTIAPHHTEIHRLVDKLTPPEAEALYVLLSSTVGDRPGQPIADEPAATEPVRRFSFAGIMRAGPDYSSRSKQILRDELGYSESS